MRAFAPLVLATALVGCIPRLPRDPVTTCHIVAESRPQLQRGLPLKDLAELSIGTPAEHHAISAWNQQTMIWSFGAVGAGALAAGLVLGFTGTQDNVNSHNTAYGLIGGAIGLFAVGLTLGFTMKATAEKARAELLQFGNTCQAP